MKTEDVTQDLVHCVYSSLQTIDFSQEDIVALLEKARKNNAASNVTGMLLYDNGSFFQVLEGSARIILPLLDTIEKDTRHSKVVRIIYEKISQRNFSEWTMGYSGITREDLKGIDGMNDFFQGNTNYIDLDEGRAKTLLKAFKDGKWRTSIS